MMRVEHNNVTPALIDLHWLPCLVPRCL